MGQHLLMRRIVVVVFVTLMTILGALALSVVVWWGTSLTSTRWTTDWAFVPPRDNPSGDVDRPEA